MTTVLVIEDEKRLLRSIREGLQEEGFETLVCSDGLQGLEIARHQLVDLIILDLMLPGMHGLEVLAQLRQEGSVQPVLVLTACDRVKDRVEGLRRGADDYLIKPFAYAELFARLRALLRRGPLHEELELNWGNLRLDLLRRTATKNELDLLLSTREFDLLAYLIRFQGNAVSRTMLARDLWRDSQITLTNVIDVYIKRLRKKIDLPLHPSHIQTIRGIGYMMPENGR